MSNRVNQRDLGRQLVAQSDRYEVQVVEAVESNNYPKVRVVFRDGYIVLVTRIPRTTKTQERHIAQNILKAATMARRQGINIAGYPGGK